MFTAFTWCSGLAFARRKARMLPATGDPATPPALFVGALQSGYPAASVLEGRQELAQADPGPKVRESPGLGRAAKGVSSGRAAHSNPYYYKRRRQQGTPGPLLRWCPGAGSRHR